MVMTRVGPSCSCRYHRGRLVSNFTTSSARSSTMDASSVIRHRDVTYGGESIGKDEGDTLVVETRYIETWNH